MNRNYFGSPYSPSSISPYSAGGYFDAPQNQPSNFPISPLNSRMWNSRPMDVESFGSSDFAAYRQNAALLQHQQPHGMNPLISSINPPSNRMMPDSMMPINAQRRASMPPIQVIYGKPGPMEIQPEEPTVGSTQQSASSSSQSSLPLFLQSAPEDAVEEYKRIIRTPKSTYEEQVKQIDQLVARLDENKQMLYKQFMTENDDREQKHRDKIHKNVGEMSDKAQEQFAKISALLRNPALPNTDRWTRVLSVYEKMDPNLRSEFEDKFANFSAS
ncbi:hypothetical protein M3Y96_01074800 [Aphelenchoides besseyi]|nr:hypothetical protein M3Y96_01074800 [Aphelenchoides besseyi]